jgi:hypothetical protein
VREELERQERADAETLLQKLAEQVMDETGAPPEFLIKHADTTRAAIKAVLAEDPDIKIMVLAAGAGRHPGPLISSIAKEGLSWGHRKLPVTIVPGDLTDDEVAELA